jgi:hypothetical protein
VLRTLFTAFIRVACFFIVIASGHVLAQEPVPLVDRARGSERVVVGRVTAVNPVWQTNEFGDRLIVSIVSVAVDETLRGPSQAAVDVEVEGGTVPHLRHAWVTQSSAAVTLSYAGRSAQATTGSRRLLHRRHRRHPVPVSGPVQVCPDRSGTFASREAKPTPLRRPARPL